VPYLHPGRYGLEAQSQGFHAYRHSEFRLEVDQALRLDIALEVGATTETVTVTDTPAALNTESGARGDVTSNAELTEMLLDGRNVTDLAYLTGGVIPRGEGADGQFAVNGARADNVSFLVDGMNNTQRRNTAAMVSPPLEGIQEFKMITSGFNAEYGRFSGGVLSMVTKSGTNRVRGSLYEFLRNDVFDARNFFDAVKSKLRQNQFGATVSGPVFIPKLYNGKERTFFLVSWESQRRQRDSRRLLAALYPTPN
jgi:TonB-dependent receptor-like protein